MEEKRKSPESQWAEFPCLSRPDWLALKARGGVFLSAYKIDVFTNLL